MQRTEQKVRLEINHFSLFFFNRAAYCTNGHSSSWIKPLNEAEWRIYTSVN